MNPGWSPRRPRPWALECNAFGVVNADVLFFERVLGRSNASDGQRTNGPRMDDQATTRTRGGMRFLKLRIAWSLGCGLACVLLIGMWIKSYQFGESLRLSSRYRVDVCRGEFVVEYADPAKAVLVGQRYM